MLRGSEIRLKLQKRYYKYYRKNIYNVKIDNIKKLSNDLNELIIKLKEKMIRVNKVFSKLLEDEDFYFLKNFQVVGEICFYKEVFDKDEDTMTLAEKKQFNKWSLFEKNTTFNHWELRYDSSQNDFTPYSKILLEKSEKSNSGDANNYNGISCSYLYHLLELNESLTEKDIAECTIKDFYPFVYVTVNLEPEEIFNLRKDIIYYDRQEHNLLFERHCILNKRFEWSQKNIEKILEINKAIWIVSRELKKNIKKLRAKFLELKKTDDLFDDFDITAFIKYRNRTHPTDIADLPLLKSLEDNTLFDIFSMFIRNDEKNYSIDHMHENKDKDFNWNFEVYRKYLNDEQRKIHFHYLMHSIFIDGSTYSFEDLIRMKAEDFIPCLDININNIVKDN